MRRNFRLHLDFQPLLTAQWIYSLCLLLSIGGSIERLHAATPLPFQSELTNIETNVPALEEEQLLGQIKQLTFAGTRSGEGYFDPTAQWMIFQSQRYAPNPFYQIYLMDLGTGTTRRVSNGLGKTTCAWIHPSRKKVLFSSTHLDPDALKKQEAEWERIKSGKPKKGAWDYDPFYDVFEANFCGEGSLHQLTTEIGYDAEASYSPDGSKILFASNRGGYSPDLSEEDKKLFEADPSYLMDLYMMKADGTEVRQLTTAKGYDGGPFFSFDGKQIVWRRFTPDGRTSEIFVMDADGTHERQLTHLNKVSWAPFFHPSGDYIIFATNLQGPRNFELYLVRSDGEGELVRVTFADAFDGLAVFLPDGEHLSWTSSRRSHKKPQIFITQWNDALARRLLGLPLAQPDFNQTTDAITAKDARQHLEYLTSDTLEGRMTGSRGEQLATKYVADIFASLELTPAGENNTYYHHFDFLPGSHQARFPFHPDLNRLFDIAPQATRGRNAIGRLSWRPEPSLGEPTGGYIIVGAHIDHLGRHKATGEIYYGADDNASGVSGLLEIAQHLVALKKKKEFYPKHDILFAVWSGEELGLLGSTAYAKWLMSEQETLYPKVAAAFNLDMVGRMEKSIFLQAAGSSLLWPSLIERAQTATTSPLTMMEDPYLATVSTAFYLRGVPTLNAFTGSHEDVHQPSDLPERINYDGIAEVATVMANIIAQTAERQGEPDYQKFPEPDPGTGAFQVYLGTIPDFTATGAPGVALQGIKPNSPAETAGLLARDVIVELAGQAITNLNEYAKILRKLKPHLEVEIHVKRKGELLKLRITPVTKKTK